MSDDHEISSYLGLRFDLSRGTCPACGGSIRVHLSATAGEAGSTACPLCGVILTVRLDAVEGQEPEVRPIKPNVGK